MKIRVQLSAIVIFLNVSLIAQIVNIPDANLKAYLLGRPAINTNADSEIQVAEAAAYSGAIDCSSLNLSNLTGIEAFNQLTELYCGNNLLTSLDITGNTALTKLYCASNQLTTLNTTSNTALTHIVCSNNQLNSLNLVSNIALNHLGCPYNQLTSLNLSANVNLVSLDCSYNLISSLNLASNTTLTILYCDSNLLSLLDLTLNTSLAELYCGNNQLTTLDLSSNVFLISLGCYSNQLSSLNVQNGNNFNVNYFYAPYNPNLTCIQVDDAAYSTANWLNIDTVTNFSTNCVTSVKNYVLNERANVSVYPNPTKNKLKFSCEANAQVINVISQIECEKKNTDTIDLSELVSGIYIIKLTNSKGQIIHRSKILKE